MIGSLIAFAVTGSITFVLYLMFESAADFSKGPIGLFMAIFGLMFILSIFGVFKAMFYRSIGITEEHPDRADEQFKRKLSPEVFQFIGIIKKPWVILLSLFIIGQILMISQIPDDLSQNQGNDDNPLLLIGVIFIFIGFFGGIKLLFRKLKGG